METQKAIGILTEIKEQMLALLDEAAEVLMNFPEVSHRSYETWVARIETALVDQNEFCLSCDYTLEDAIGALIRAEGRKAA